MASGHHSMTANEQPDSSRYLRIAVIGVEFSSPILAGLVGGYYLGEYFHRPWLGLVGLFGGVFLGFYRLIFELRNYLKGNQ
jgi:F0F1-type ATP synthase assembly protein I